MRRLLATSLLAAALAVGPSAAGEAAGVSAAVSPAFGGCFRPGCPVLFRVAVTNDGPALDGQLDLVVEGVAWRQPLRLGAGTSATVEVLAAVHTATARERVRVCDGGGSAILDVPASLGLRELPADAPPQVAVWRRGADALPTMAAGYLVLDALVVAGDGADVPPPARAALERWVTGGGHAAFALEAGEPVGAESLLAGLGPCSGRSTAAEWLEAAGEAAPPVETSAGRRWRVGLGWLTVAADVGAGELASALRDEGTRGWPGAGSAGASRVLEAFGGPRWSVGARWRVAGATLALLAAVGLVARLVPRGWGRWRRAACVAAAAALLTAAAWALVLPGGRGVLESAAIEERVVGESAGRRCEFVCASAVGRQRLALDLGDAEVVVPLYSDPREVGSWRDVVIARDERGRWTVACDATRRVRRGFLAWWSWGMASLVESGGRGLLVRGGHFAEPSGPGLPPSEAWRPLRELARWSDLERAMVAWQARRGAAGVVHEASWAADERSRVDGRGLLGRWCGRTLRWTERPSAR